MELATAPGAHVDECVVLSGTVACRGEVEGDPSNGGVSIDVDAILESFGLQTIRRFCGQMHWGRETEQAHLADGVETGLKLENVAAHSWHVADAVLLLADRYPDLDVGRCVSLAVLHDKLELYTGDYDPVGPDGLGSGTHAFDPVAQREKAAAEREALERYLSRLRPSVRERQRVLLTELIDGTSEEARFVRGVDKLQALAFVLEKKAGGMSDDHVRFTLRYSNKGVRAFPGLSEHRRELVSRLLDEVAKARDLPRSQIERCLGET